MKFLHKYKIFNESIDSIFELLFNSTNDNDDDIILSFISMIKDIHITDKNNKDILYYSIVDERFNIFKYLIDNYKWDINNYLEPIIDESTEIFFKYIVDKIDINTKIHNKPLIFELYYFYGADLVLYLLKKHPLYNFKIKYNNKYFFNWDDDINNKELYKLINSNNKELSDFILKKLKMNKFNL